MSEKRDSLKINKKKKLTQADYKKMYPQAGRRTTEGAKQMKERIKHGDMHLHYKFPDKPECKKQYQKAKKEFGLS